MTAEPPKATGWLSLAGGMSAVSRNWREAREDQASLLVNATVRSGFAEVRPSFRLFDVAWESPAQHAHFSTGKIQGSGFFRFPLGPRFLYAIDGCLISIDPIARTGAIIPVEKVTRGLARSADFVHFAQRGASVIISDSQNPPLIFNGFEARVADTGDNELKVCASMAEGWGRLAVLSADRRRIFFSNHSDDPTREPLDFTEGGYFMTAQYFTLEKSVGRGIALQFMPYLDSGSGLGALVCFCENATLFFDVSKPRETWLTSDIRRNGLPHIGACAHRSIVPVGTDIAFSDHAGRLRTVQSARRDAEQMAFVPFDRALWDIYAQDDPGLRAWRCSIEFDNRLLTTVSPTLMRTPDGRTRVAHRGIIALELDKGEPFADSEYPIWGGLWTGISPATLDKGLLSPLGTLGREMCLALCVDPDGINRLYEISTLQTGHDLAPNATTGAGELKSIRSTVASRWIDGGMPGVLKKLEDSKLTVNGWRGRVSVNGFWQSDSSPPVKWFTHSKAFAARMSINKCCVIPAAASGATLTPGKLPRMAEVTDPITGRGIEQFRKGRAIFQLSGPWKLEEWIAALARQDESPNATVTCESPATLPTAVPVPCPLRLFDYAAATEPTLPP